MREDTVEGLVAKYIPDGSVVALGSGHLSESFLKRLAFRMVSLEEKFLFIPTSMHLAALAAELRIPITSIDEHEVDVAVEFPTQLDHDYNFLKSSSHSLIRDKMICQSATDLICVCEKKDFVERLSGAIAFEIAMFGSKRTLLELSKFGKTDLLREGKRDFHTESANLLALCKPDAIFSLEDLEFQTKQIPGVIETGLFIGYADRMILFNPGIEAKSRVQVSTSKKKG
ncbi:MAG: ribose-5-phosphate isomerase A [Candidatus Diapherotrites archaeon]|nr:ribose-5-phosphate isomerase A [Candidatus Diapherotrites archaeon]